ncbi:uncharacterized protein SCHCODRAFT_02673171 [Schizophyllum commune H4-8]|nr:uncharacterized protein SCHCODRAFT_02673171 [Schizophyllum commune H4-8]KAI5886134.1 hypothetical protein SCHCODRAFT_02673171 [Schizophyllum commune H4-8]
MPPTHATELRRMLQVFLDITEERSGALSPRAALAKLKSALARGHLFSGFSQGPPEWQPGLRPLRLDRSTTEPACDELNLYGLLCAEVGAVKEYSSTSLLWNSLYAVQPVILQWIEFFHPMNRNIRLKDDAEYSYGVGVTLISLFGGLIYPRLVMETQQLASWIIGHRLDVYITDFWVNLPRYVVDPSGGTAARAMEWMYTLFRCLRGARMPARIGELLLERTSENPRRLCRSIAYYAEVIPVKEYATLTDNLWELACHLISEAPELVPSTVRLVSAIKYAADFNAWTIAMGSGFYLQNLWIRTSSLRALEISLRAGVFEILVDLSRKLPAFERALHENLDIFCSKSHGSSGGRPDSIAKYVAGTRAVKDAAAETRVRLESCDAAGASTLFTAPPRVSERTGTKVTI